MHVRYSSRLVWVIVASALFWMGILFALTFSDYLDARLDSDWLLKLYSPRLQRRFPHLDQALT